MSDEMTNVNEEMARDYEIQQEVLYYAQYDVDQMRDAGLSDKTIINNLIEKLAYARADLRMLREATAPTDGDPDSEEA